EPGSDPGLFSFGGSMKPHLLEIVIAKYNDAWNRRDVEAILAMHTDDTVFENHQRRQGRRQGGAARNPGQRFRDVPRSSVRSASHLRARWRRHAGMDSERHAREALHEGNEDRHADRPQGALE